MRQLLDVDLRLIRIFRVIVEAQGIAGAGLVLNLSQSRISTSLAELEARLGVRLCRRGRAGFALTEAGRSVYDASHDLFEAVDKFCNKAGTVSLNLKRVVKLGAVDALATNNGIPLAKILGDFRQHAHSVLIDFMIAGPEALEAELVAGARDVIIMPTLTKKSDLAYVPISAERQSLYCARNHPLFNEDDSIAERNLQRHAIVARGYLHSQDLKRLGHRQADATVEMMEAQLILILSGGFIGYLPAHYAASWVERGELRCLCDKSLSYDSSFYAVSQKNATENPLLRRLLASLTGNGASGAKVFTADAR
jgi:LysR family transcriptional regulator, transcriptional activator for bauABCD operon